MLISNKQDIKKKIELGGLRLSFEDNGDLNLKYTSNDNTEQVQFILNKLEMRSVLETLSVERGNKTIKGELWK